MHKPCDADRLDHLEYVIVGELVVHAVVVVNMGRVRCVHRLLDHELGYRVERERDGRQHDEEDGRDGDNL